MKNTLISYPNLEPSVKKLFKTWLDEEDQDEISFPYKGKMTNGYLFQHDDVNYLIAMNAKAVMTLVDEDDDDDDVSEDLDLDDSVEEIESEDAA